MVARPRIPALLAALLALGGCATSTRTAKMGPLPTGPLVTLIVSDDRAVVERECREVPALGPVLGCSIWETVQPDGKTDVKMMKVVRYTDTMPSADRLVTLVVSDDRRVVEHECRDVPALGPVLGCSIWRTIRTDHGTTVKVMKVVRYAESVPSELTMEIDVHELCHVVAALQPIDDPCHVGNDGVIRAGDPNARGMTR